MEEESSQGRNAKNTKEYVGETIEAAFSPVGGGVGGNTEVCGALAKDLKLFLV